MSVLFRARGEGSPDAVSSPTYFGEANPTSDLKSNSLHESSSLIVEKRTLRKARLEERRALLSSAPHSIDLASKAIANQLLKALDWANVRHYSVFLPMLHRGEINTWHFIQTMQEVYPNAVACVPVVVGKELKHALLPKNPMEEGALAASSLGVLEPTSPQWVDNKALEVVIVPLLAFDSKGFRLGYGGGYYDRLLEECAENCVFIGVGMDAAYCESLPSEPHDIPLHYCVTPTKIWRF